MEILPYIIVALVFFGLGAYFEKRYASVISAEVATIKADVAAVKAVIGAPAEPPKP